MGIEILIPLTFFIFLTLVIVLPSYFKSRERARMQDTLRAAIEKGQPLPPEVIDAMTSPAVIKPTRTRDLRRGVIWVAVGVGITAFGLLNDFNGWGRDWDVDGGLIGIAAIPVTIGLAFIVLSFFNKNVD